MSRHLTLLLAAALMLTACHKDKHEDEPQQPATQSVLVYIAGDNNLQQFIIDDVKQMMEGSKLLGKDCNLLLFVDQKGKRPYFMKLENGDTLRVKTLEEEVKSSNAETLRSAMKWMVDNYEARNYGLVLWGHADGWVVWQPAQSRPRRSYGQDTTGGEEWMNISEMADALATLPHLRFIFADCCCFQCVESAYELRHVTDYLIGSAAEIPGEGAPYQTVIPHLFDQREDFYALVCDDYFEQVSVGYQEPVSVVKSSEMDQLAQATRVALTQSLQPISEQGENYPDVEGLIYYYDQTLFDMQDFMLSHAPEHVYTEWKRTFDKAVVYKKMAEVWLANHIPYLDKSETMFRDFNVTAERYGGISMFVPQNRYTTFIQRQNERIKKMEWYSAAGLSLLGW
ncbi:MAG: hypothetical protein IKM76_01765 [Prevotella sp.]|nr:hypothetical protein [Prevotella sp.]MBR6826877.1 hypothetical protein [Prevotella sp.]